MTTNPTEQSLRNLAVLCIEDYLAGRLEKSFSELTLDENNVPIGYCSFLDGTVKCCCMQGRNIDTPGGYRPGCRLPNLAGSLRENVSDGDYLVAEFNDLVLKNLRYIKEKLEKGNPNG